jgi:hypothetical protein
MKDKGFTLTIVGLVAILLFVLWKAFLPPAGARVGDAVGASKTKIHYELLCIDNVEYIYYKAPYIATLAAHLQPDGKPYVCDQEVLR